MNISSETRVRLGVATSIEEIVQFSQNACLAGQCGLPVLLIPFGDGEEKGIRIDDGMQLERIGKELLDQRISCFGYVHVIKIYKHAHKT